MGWRHCPPSLSATVSWQRTMSVLMNVFLNQSLSGRFTGRRILKALLPHLVLIVFISCDTAHRWVATDRWQWWQTSNSRNTVLYSSACKYMDANDVWLVNTGEAEYIYCVTLQCVSVSEEGALIMLLCTATIKGNSTGWSYGSKGEQRRMSQCRIHNGFSQPRLEAQTWQDRISIKKKRSIANIFFSNVRNFYLIWRPI